MSKKFMKAEEFRTLATDKDYEELQAYLVREKSSAWKTDECPYGFSRTSGVNLLKEREQKEASDEAAPNKKKEKIQLQVDLNKIDAKKRALYITDETWERFQAVTAKLYPALDKKNVVDALLNYLCDLFES